MDFKNLFTYERTAAAHLISSVEYPWEALDLLSEYILRLGRTLDSDIYCERCEGIWIAKSASVSSTAELRAPLIIGEGSEVRHCAYIRGSVIIGKGCIVGNSSEIKNSVLFDGVRAPHYNYIGDSILGYKANLGAGTIISNLRSDREDVVCSLGEERIDSKRQSFGALIGDLAEIGCSSVICPGTVISKGARVYPLTRVRGFVPEGTLYRGESIISDIL